MIYPYHGKEPNIHPSVFIADYVTISGDVTIGEDTNIWFGTVIRGDVAPTIIGKRCSIQDLSCLHQSPGNPLIIEDEVIVGHKVMLHSAIIRKRALIGMGAIVLDRAEIGEGAIVAAGTVVPPGKKIPPHTVVMGNPAKVVREVTDEERKDMDRIVRQYVERGKYYQSLKNRVEGGG